MKKVYLDNNATAPLDQRVVETMLEELKNQEYPCNPSSIHAIGQAAKVKLNKCRQQVAKNFSVKPSEITFTSGGTEAINTILKGFFDAFHETTKSRPCHFLSSKLEHPAVLETLEFLEKKGAKVTFIPASFWGAVSSEQVSAAIAKEPVDLIVLMAANNITGVKTDIKGISQVAFEAKIPFFVDATAWIGKEPFPVFPGISAFCFSGHKIHGPQGTGIAFIRSNFKITPLIHGGGQEHRKRAGTENMLGIIGITKAIELINIELPEAAVKMEFLKNHLIERLKQNGVFIQILGDGPKICNTLQIAFPSCDAESLLIELDLKGVFVSHGSACSSGSLEPSPVLLNMGFSRSLAKSSLRFSLSRQTTLEDIEHAADVLTSILINHQKAP